MPCTSNQKHYANHYNPCDHALRSLLVQSVGGGIASIASNNKNQSMMDMGTHIMVAGICWQMFTMVVFTVLAIIFVVNVGKANIKLDPKLKVFCWGMAIVTVMIFIRCIYRTAELMQGWRGYIIEHEIYFAMLDFVPMIIAIVAYNIWHPGMYISESEVPVEGKGVVQDVEAVVVSTKPDTNSNKIKDSDSVPRVAAVYCC